jgi:hypothetical protein
MTAQRHGNSDMELLQAIRRNAVSARNGFRRNSKNNGAKAVGAESNQARSTIIGGISSTYRSGSQ